VVPLIKHRLPLHAHIERRGFGFFDDQTLRLARNEKLAWWKNIDAKLHSKITVATATAILVQFDRECVQTLDEKA
jgi:hypothetical protein